MKSAALGLALLVGGCATILPQEPKPLPLHSEYFIQEEPCERAISPESDLIFGLNVRTKCLDLYLTPYRQWFFFVDPAQREPYTSMGPTGRVSIYNGFPAAENAVPLLRSRLNGTPLERWAVGLVEFEQERLRQVNPELQSLPRKDDELEVDAAVKRVSALMSQWQQEYQRLHPQPVPPELVIVPLTEETRKLYFSP